MEQKSPMLRQIESVPDLMEALLEPLDRQARRLASDGALGTAGKAVLTGCGDSYCAAGVAASLFRELAGMDAEVRTAMDVSRHMPGRRLVDDGGPVLLVGISASGNVTRVAECMERVRKRDGCAWPSPAARIPRWGGGPPICCWRRFRPSISRRVFAPTAPACWH